jgi:hypothetical protein
MPDLRRPLKRFMPHFLKANEPGQAETLEVNHEIG